jgi:WD40 repeat protein
VRVDAERSQQVRDHCLLLLSVSESVLCADFWAFYRAVYSVSFSPDGTKLATGSSDEKIKLWNVETGACESTLSGHSDPILSVYFSPCRTKIAGGGGLEKFRQRNMDFRFGSGTWK